MPNAKLLYGEITCLSNKHGYCFASNSYFTKLYKVAPPTITSWINKLVEQGYITVEFERKGKQIIRRIIRLTHVCSQISDNRCSENNEIGGQISDGGYSEKVKDNNTSNNNTSNNNIYIPSKVTKHKYGEYKNVLLTEKELDTLCNELGEEKAKGVIKHFSELKEMKGYKYKSDYLALRKWGIRAYEDTHGSSNVRANEGYF